VIGIRPAAFAAIAIAANAAAAGSTGGWQTAHPGYQYSFPSDYGAHESYRDEWWYYSGNVRDHAGHPFGFELTIFRYGIEHPMPGASAWDIDDLYFAHFALVDAAGRRFLSYDRTERAALGGAGAATTDERAWVGDWRIQRTSSGQQIVHAADSRSALDLTLTPRKAPVIEGQGGAFRMGACAACYAQYYSFTRLAATGSIALDGSTFDVAGTAWGDHEWGSDAIDPTSSAWDWFSIQLDDGIDVMIGRLHHADGATLPQSSGTFVDAAGAHHFLSLSDFDVVPTGWWTSPRDGARYPSGWIIALHGERAKLTVTPVMQDQELDTSRSTQLTYWEGACTIRGTVGGHAASGVGYTELTGYSKPGG
jgi:predicted secreted hydrolase